MALTFGNSFTDGSLPGVLSSEGLAKAGGSASRRTLSRDWQAQALSFGPLHTAECPHELAGWFFKAMTQASMAEAAMALAVELAYFFFFATIMKYIKVSHL